MIQKAAAIENWQLAASSDNALALAPHLVHNFGVEHQITQVTQPLYHPDLVPCNFWLFTELKSPLKGKRFQNVDSGKYNGAADGD